jgi:hypothetical protein
MHKNYKNPSPLQNSANKIISEIGISPYNTEIMNIIKTKE